ncbi:MAG: hypothetical protein K2X01_08035 [Cyanobacteria bacterium]|nr:hypothetical protein [Cyanobacteriota bacterium]
MPSVRQTSQFQTGVKAANKSMFGQYSTRLDRGLSDVFAASGKGKIGKNLPQWLRGFLSRPGVRKTLQHPVSQKVMGGLEQIHQGQFFSKTVSPFTKNVLKKLPTGISKPLQSAGQWVGKTSVGKFFSKVVKTGVKGPAFLAFGLDLLLSSGSAVKAAASAYKNSDGFISGLFNGALAFGKSLGKSAIGIVGGMAAAGAVAMAVTGPVGWIAGTAAYIAGRWVLDKITGNNPESSQSKSPQAAPSAFENPEAYGIPGAQQYYNQTMKEFNQMMGYR